MRAQMVWLPCFASGAGTGLCLLYPVAGPAVFVLPIPALLLLLKQKDGRSTLKLSAAFCLGMCMAAYAPALTIEPVVDTNLVIWLDLAIYISICLFHGLLFTTALWCGLRLPCTKALRWLSVAVFWTLAEWLCGIGPFAWPTLQLSLALWQYPALLQGARWGGHLLISALIIAINTLICQGLMDCKTRPMLLPLAGALLLFLANAGLYVFSPPLPEADVKVALAQPGIKTIGENRDQVCEKALALAENAASCNPSIILLPESVLPTFFQNNESLQSPWADIAKDAGADLLVGGSNKSRSSVYQFNPEGKLVQIYRKQREVPIFENGSKGRPFQWKTDNRAGIMSSDSGLLGIMICYESLFSSMARYAADEGAALLMVATNDSWFDADSAKKLHLANSVYRAVETGRNVVQAGLNGYTVAIDAQGHLTYSLPSNVSGMLEAKVSFAAEDTPYLRWGYGWLWLSLAIILVNAVSFKYITIKNR